MITKSTNPIHKDIDVWFERELALIGVTGLDKLLSFLKLMVYNREFRNIFYYRVRAARALKFLAPGESTLFINTKIIGPGLYIQHGFATIIAAKSIGANCWINQQVTIGFSDSNSAPVIEDNVTINAGAKVIGGVLVGANSRIGANAVVVKDVPPNCTVVGVPARIVRRDGIRVDG